MISEMEKDKFLDRHTQGLGKTELTKLDGGTIEERIAEAKRFLGLRPDQTFQDIEIDNDED